MNSILFVFALIAAACGALWGGLVAVVFHDNTAGALVALVVFLFTLVFLSANYVGAHGGGYDGR